MISKIAGLSKLIFSAVVMTVLFSQPIYAQETKNGLTWYTDVSKAGEASHKTKKPIFALFTGSDWCIWCHRLENNVFDKPGFKAWAQKNVTLLLLDFPRQKQLPEELAKQNNDMQKFFQVQGFPTVWIFNMNRDDATKKFNISALGSLGYPQSEPGKEEMAFIETADKILKTDTRQSAKAK